MKRMKKWGVVVALFLILSVQLNAVEGDTTSLSFMDFMQGPEVYSFLQDTHTILGYTSAALGVAACVFNPALVDDDIHETLGSAAAVTSAVNIGVGVLNYGDRIFSGPQIRSEKTDVIHAMMSVAGSILMIAANSIEPEDDDEGSGSGAFTHAALGITGASLMASSIIFEW